MEKKQNKSSINTVIYLLLGAMLVSVVMVSVFTVASRRRTAVKVPEKVTADSLDTADEGMDQPPDTVTPSTPGVGNVKVPDSTNIPEVTEKAPEDAAAPSSNINNDNDVEASGGMRYFVAPVSGMISKSFEIDIPVYSMTMNDYRAHTGIDISAPVGSEVVSASSGIVCKVWNDKLMGRAVTIDHGGNIFTTYMNLTEDSAADLNVGDSVMMGQKVGNVGESALVEISEEPHLHLEMMVDGAYVDPLEYMGVEAGQDSKYEE